MDTNGTIIAWSYRADAIQHADGTVTILVDEQDEYTFPNVEAAKASEYWPEPATCKCCGEPCDGNYCADCIRTEAEDRAI